MKTGISANKGFTLLEILIVLALTIIVMGLVFGPVTQSFKFTRRAEVLIRAQDNARIALGQISRDLADAMYIYDNTRDPVNFPVVDMSGNPTVVPVYYAKVDLVLPRMRGYCTSSQHPQDVTREYPRGEEAAPTCPEDGSQLELRPVEPLTADRKIVRYFLGLRDPSNPYANGYMHRLAGAEEDNMYILYRAEFSPYDDRLFDTSRSVLQNLADPDFFYDRRANGYPNGETYSEAWKKISRAVVTLGDTDLVTIEYDKQGNPSVTPTVRFAPTAVYNDALVPTAETDDDAEHGDTPPTVYKGTHGHWVLPYEITAVRRAEDGSQIVYRAVRSADGTFMGIFKGDDLVFNMTYYEETKLGSRYGVGEVSPAQPEVAFTVDTLKGTVRCAFPVVNVGISDGLSSMLGGQMAVSCFPASTDEINAEYEKAAGDEKYEDRYRRLVFNEPSTHILKDARVVPGSEKVVAPDARPGPSYSRPTLYARAPFYLYEAGLNQYKLDLDYPVLDASGNVAPGMKGAAAVYFHSYQTQQPGSGVPLPSGTNNVFLYYEVQNNRKDDSLRANYVTKSLMTVMLGVRIYDPSSGKPQVVQLTNKVRLRNIVP